MGEKHEHELSNKIREAYRVGGKGWSADDVRDWMWDVQELEFELAALKMEKEYLRGKAQAVVDGKTGGGFDKFSGFDDYIIPYQLVDELADALLGDQDA